MVLIMEKTLNEKAEEVKSILENETFREAVTNLEQSIINQWKSSKEDDTQFREYTWQKLQALKMILIELQQFIFQKQMIQNEQDQNL